MSPSWRERVRIDLAPGSVALTRWSRGIKPRVLQQGSYAAEAPAPDWQAAVDLLDRALTEPRWRKVQADVRLSSHFVRLHLLPWSEALATDAERLAYARMELEAIHGERVAGWTLTIDDAPVGAPAPVCAVDTALLEAVRASCRRAGLTVCSIRPAFAVALQQRRARARHARSGFAYAESGRVTLALYEGHTCRWLTNPRVGAALLETLSAELAQAQALGSVGGGGRLQVVFGDRREGLPQRLGSWDVAVAEPGEPGAGSIPVGALKVAGH